MKKILENLGTIFGNDGVSVVELEDLGLVAVNYDRSDGERLEAWKCDPSGKAIDKNVFYLMPVQVPISYDTDGNPDQWDTVGFEIV